MSRNKYAHVTDTKCRTRAHSTHLSGPLNPSQVIVCLMCEENEGVDLVVALIIQTIMVTEVSRCIIAEVTSVQNDEEIIWRYV